ncbi:histone-like nucleoid-structuring protein Lsr2 [Rhodococcus pyridinivorans]|uniref:histone-like nucleoid-structuring protein Lsr2 n=1 Tax=Rhodococcus pyridinivorans TaxID=103816 RepID=UPI002658AAF6|nr:Lsr2 family protein [Rhodococcus pyridinivorans]
MATVTTTHVIDDIDGTQGATTIRFSVGRSQYEIDLCEENADKLYEALGPFISKARKARPETAKRDPDRIDQGLVRKWAQENGLAVNARGRVPNELVEQYKQAHS